MFFEAYAIDNAQVWTGDGSSYAGYVLVADGVVKDASRGQYRGNLPAVDLEGAALSPGLIDLMMAGAFGFSITAGEELQLTRQCLRLGITSCVMSVGNISWERTRRQAESTRASMAYAGTDASRNLGLYMEGPFKQRGQGGVSISDYRLPATHDNVRRLLDELGDTLVMVNVSPGARCDEQAVRFLKTAGKVVSMSHSNAGPDRVLRCVEAGTTVLGHVWNNNTRGAHIEPGVVQPTVDQIGLTDDRVRYVHIVCDGVHVHPTNVRLTLRCKGIEGLCIVSDNLPRAGCPDGPFEWEHGRTWYKKENALRDEKGRLAGSVLLLPDQFRSFVNFTGVPPSIAIQTVTLNPAASIGMDSEIGIIAPGRDADLVAWDRDLRIRRVWRRGRELQDMSDLAEVAIDGRALS
jgi:N-acetylglucosamine-6-phosphate deacetylase